MASSIVLHTVPDNDLFKKFTLKKYLTKIKYFESTVGAAFFLHDAIEVMLHNQYREDSYSEINPDDLDTLFGAYQLFVKQIVNHDISSQQIAEDLATVGVDEELVEDITRNIQARRSEVKDRLTSATRQDDMIDFDWKLHLSVASDTVSDYRQPLLLLNMTTHVNGTAKEILLELTKADTDLLIQELENIKGTLVKYF
eukprot:TRINITY_DN6441_c0_g1_i1.p1 TRINITY_DN6441_c0_g1~~TRINITY_DN6441_c0_g1_i1.p1  ORF type:complete len:205 (-),score=47.64 TRINITY_DN6441_c0_g1_i1:36-629(-)